MAERVVGEFVQAPGTAVVEQVGVVLEQGGPGLAVTLLERLNRGLHRGVVQGGRDHRPPTASPLGGPVRGGCGWALPSAILAAPDRDPADRLELHARAAMALLLPVCTPSGRRKLDRRS